MFRAEKNDINDFVHALFQFVWVHYFIASFALHEKVNILDS
jgi:hypothetical protein